MSLQNFLLSQSKIAFGCSNDTFAYKKSPATLRLQENNM